MFKNKLTTTELDILKNAIEMTCKKYHPNYKVESSKFFTWLGGNIANYAALNKLTDESYSLLNKLFEEDTYDTPQDGYDNNLFAFLSEECKEFLEHVEENGKSYFLVIKTPVRL